VIEPTDLELMLFADGELEARRRAEVEAWIARDARARAKLSSLHVVAEAVRESASGAPSPSVADGVMHLVSMGETPPRTLASVEPSRPPRRTVKRAMVAVTALAAAAVVLASLGERGVAPPVAMGKRHGSDAAATSVPQTAPVVAMGDPPGVSQAPPGEARQDPSREHGVEVWSVEFGSRSGAVFYVPSDTSPTDTTTVVWLSQDPREGSEEAE